MLNKARSVSLVSNIEFAITGPPEGRGNGEHTKEGTPLFECFYSHVLFVYSFSSFFHSTATLWGFYMPDTFFVIRNETTENMLLPDVFHSYLLRTVALQ